MPDLGTSDLPFAVDGPVTASGLETFSLVSQSESLTTAGIAHELKTGDIGNLAGNAGAFFRSLKQGPDYLVGALPFDRAQPAYLFQPELVSHQLKSQSPKESRSYGRAGVSPQGTWIVNPEPSAAKYREAVAKALAAMTLPDSDLRKVVLSRSLRLNASGPIDPIGLLEHLAQDPLVTAFMTRLPGKDRMLVGATPELLVAKSGTSVVSHPLAGSARRISDPASDKQSASALEKSEKDQREHAAVVEAVLDTLSPYCSSLRAPDGPSLFATATIWHLGTRIVGTLKDPDTPALELAAALHPTPAVCGLPRTRAADVIAALEGYDRGFYAGAVGWTNRSGDGAWHVSIRCAEIEGTKARLYAGAGIVPGSDPVAEADETSAKFLPLLSALGIDERGRPLRERAA